MVTRALAILGKHKILKGSALCLLGYVSRFARGAIILCCVEDMTRLHSVEYCSRWMESSIALIVNLEYRDGIVFLTFNHDPGRSKSCI